MRPLCFLVLVAVLFFFHHVLEIHCEKVKLSPIPGLDKIAIGFDVVHGEMRNVVLKFTYAKNNTWTNPNYPDMKYDVPDQISVTNFPESSIVKEQLTSKSTQEYSKQVATDVGLSFSYGMFSMSADVSVAKSFIESSSSTSTYVSTTQRIGLWKMSTIPPFLPDYQPSDWFQLGLDSLPDTILTDEDRQKYLDFIKYFGTHYLSEAHFGGKASMNTAVNVFVYEVDTSETITVDIHTEFYAKLTGHFNESIQYKSKLYKEHHISEQAMQGGNPEITVWDKWIPTVKENPVVIYYKLSPLTDLITKAADQKKKDNMQKVIDNFIRSSYYPSTCLDIKSAGYGNVDGNYTLYYQGDVQRPFHVYCFRMDTPLPSEYVNVLSGTGINFGSYCSTGERTSCATHYSKLRIDPYTLHVDINDQTFSSVSCGEGGSRPYALGNLFMCGCKGSFDSDLINLTGTDLVIDPSVGCSVISGKVNTECVLIGNQRLHVSGDLDTKQCGTFAASTPSSKIAGSKFSVKLNTVRASK